MMRSVHPFPWCAHGERPLGACCEQQVWGQATTQEKRPVKDFQLLSLTSEREGGRKAVREGGNEGERKGGREGEGRLGGGGRARKDGRIMKWMRIK